MSCSSNKIEIPDIDENIVACGIHQPQKNLPWLKTLIEKAETDQTGNYWGKIWLVNYKGQDIFVTNMMLGSGGVSYWVFDCEGNYLNDGGRYNLSAYTGVSGTFSVEDKEDFIDFISSLKLHEDDNDVPVIYSTFHFKF
jgi:hypothetical protein